MAESEALAPWAEIVPDAEPMTVDDLLTLPDDGWQYETPAPRPARHRASHRPCVCRVRSPRCGGAGVHGGTIACRYGARSPGLGRPDTPGAWHGRRSAPLL